MSKKGKKKAPTTTTKEICVTLPNVCGLENAYLELIDGLEEEISSIRDRLRILEDIKIEKALGAATTTIVPFWITLILASAAITGAATWVYGFVQLVLAYV